MLNALKIFQKYSQRYIIISWLLIIKSRYPPHPKELSNEQKVKRQVSDLKGKHIKDIFKKLSKKGDTRVSISIFLATFINGNSDV